ncbi:MAG: ABC transporter substrate-binding protein [Fibromonadaceae bacterium]|jgi:branched-chain amino acid transport system substrate-binding protein|nr:ABC transporter substrate-binding protein [Fibromonadaceae bacterium]
MKNKFFGLSILCLLLLVSCGRNEHSTTVGVLFPLTGDIAVYGNAIRDGILLAHEESDIKNQIRLIIEDDRGDTRTAMTIFNSLLLRNADIIIGGGMSSVAAALAPLAQQERIPMLSPTASLPSLTHSGEYFFRIWSSDNYEGRIIADYIANVVQARTAALLYVNLDYGVGIRDVFTKEFEEKGGQVVFNEGYEPGATDFRTQLVRIRNSNPDVLFIPGYFQEVANILRQAKELNLNVQIFGISSLYDERIIQLAGEQAEGIIFTYPMYDSNSGDEIIQTFVRNFSDRFGNRPSAFAAHGYDAMKVVEHAIKQLKEKKEPITKESLRNEISKIRDFNGVSGKFSFDENGDVIKSMRFMTVRNGEFVTIE